MNIFTLVITSVITVVELLIKSGVIPPHGKTAKKVDDALNRNTESLEKEMKR